ncbi:hypothetical protein MPSEU_000841800 [Mayamaea pseudoterrestris]|nr:hypothetical protein MPSEU_000841800 [Mayamaea pseudoterrestris]
MTTVRYFIPEDGDLELQPNVFLAPKPRQPQVPPTLEEVKRSFPLSGRYHFRFKTPLVAGTDRDKGSMAVWMDCVDDRMHVPTWKGGIVAKVTRIGIEDDDDEDDDDFVRSTPAPTSNGVGSHHHHHVPSPAASYDLFDAPAPISAPPQQQHVAQSAPNLLDGGHSPAQATQHKESPLLDMSHNHFQQQQAAHADFFGMSAPTQQQHTPPVSGNYSNNNMYGNQQQQQSGGYGNQQQPNAFGQQARQPPPRPGSNVFDAFSQAKNPGAFGDINDFSL